MLATLVKQPVVELLMDTLSMNIIFEALHGHAVLLHGTEGTGHQSRNWAGNGFMHCRTGGLCLHLHAKEDLCVGLQH